jgi:putative FmdB family regulatory protein
VPIYEYACSDCGARFERYQRSWAEAARCPGCQSAAVERLLSSFALAGTRASDDRGGAGGAGGACCGGSCGCAH